MNAHDAGHWPNSWELGGVTIPNRVVLAPLAGIGNWFVRLQAKRYGAGLAVSEMVSSFAVHYRNERTLRELLRIHPDEHPVSVQLFGHDPDVMASAAERVAAAGADLIDINMGCPVPKVCKTGAGRRAAGATPACARAGARGGARERAAGDGQAALGPAARRPARGRGRAAAGVRGRRSPGSRSIRATPPSATTASPTTSSPRRLVEELPVPVLDLGRPADRRAARAAFEQTGAAAVLLARGSLGNPWLFEQLLGVRSGDAERDEILAELDWVIDRAVEHLGAERATRYLRKFYPWYVERLSEYLGGSAGSAAGRAADGADARGRPRALPRRAVGSRGRQRLLALRGARSPLAADRATPDRATIARRLYSSAHCKPDACRFPPCSGFFRVQNPNRLHRTLCPRTSSSPQKDWPTSSPSSTS